MDTINCPKCNRVIKYGKPTCFYCGEKLADVKPANKCPQCGSDNPETNKFCLECGTTLMGEAQSLSQYSRIPSPPAHINLESVNLRGIIFSPEGLQLEKGYPPQYITVQPGDINQINVYRKETMEIKKMKKIQPPGAGRKGRFQNSTPKYEELKDIKETFVCEFIMGNTVEFLIGDKFNYGTALGPEREFTLINNFSKLVKKLVRHCENVQMNKGTLFFMTR